MHVIDKGSVYEAEYKHHLINPKTKIKLNFD